MSSVTTTTVVDASEITAEKNSRLFSAVLTGRADVCSALLDSGADVNATAAACQYTGELEKKEPTCASPKYWTTPLLLDPKYWTTPLLLASEKGHKDVCALLLDRGANVKAKNHAGFTPLHMASQNGHKDVCELLLNRGVDVGLTTLHLASVYGHKDVCSLLLDRGAGVNVRNAWGRTPLHALVAGLFSKRDYAYAICELLINRGADLNVKDKDGCTPLHGAVTASKELCELFIDNGANMRAKTNRGEMPLHSLADGPWALKSKDDAVEICRLLFKRGMKRSDVHAPDYDGNTPLSQAGKSNLYYYLCKIANGDDEETTAVAPPRVVGMKRGRDDDDYDALKKKVAELSAENDALKKKLSMIFSYARPE